MLTVVDEVEKAAEKYKVSLGPVYILTIIYFITRGESPIFDRFAYSAVKSLYYSKLRHADFTPEDVWYECPSGKKPKDILKVINDYKWYLEQVFGKSNIARDIDRSLWVYGHPKVISCKKPNNL